MTQSRKIVFIETGLILAGEAVCVALMLGVYWLLGGLSVKVAYSAAVGLLLSTLNFFVMAMVVTLAADRAENQDVAGGQKLVKGSYPVRILVLALILFGCGKSGMFDILAMALPLLFVRPVMLVTEFFRKKEVTGK